jgi:putative chitinase
VTLQLGSTGPAVVALQHALEAMGFDVGPFDGDFGPDTEAQVTRFQAVHKLTVDGIAGPETLALLGLGADTPAPALVDITAKVTVEMVARMFPGTLIGNIDKNLPLVLSALSAAHLGDRPMVLMALGTIRAECAPFLPLVEGVSDWNTRDRDFDLYDNDRELGNGPAPDGANFRGRGFVQLTGRDNYTLYSGVIGKPLVADPDLAADPTIAAQLLAAFLARSEVKIRAALADNDLGEARRLVNGGANGLDAFIDAYRRGLQEISDV